MQFFSGDSGVQAYRSILSYLVNNQTNHEVRGESMYSEVIGASVFVQDARTLDFLIEGRADNRRYKVCEALWDLGPSDDISILSAVNGRIERFVEDQPEYLRDFATWAYGPTVWKELPRVVRHLDADPYTRRAVITIPRDLRVAGTPPCLISLQFFVRKNKLHCVANMRSNDAWLGVPLDFFQFALIQNVVAGAIGIPIGSYTHNAGSLHLYSRDVEKAQKCLDTNGVLDKTYFMPECGEYAIKDIVGGDLLRGLVLATTDDYMSSDPQYWTVDQALHEYCCIVGGSQGK